MFFLLAPRRATTPLETESWHQYLDDVYGAGYNRMEPEGAFIILTLNDQLPEFSGEIARVSLWQGISASLE